MARVFRRKLTRWVLDGRRVTKGTPGAKAETSLSREWYGLIRGEYVKLSPLRDVADQLLRKRLRESEERRFDRFAPYRQTPLTEHIEKFREHLTAIGRSQRYISETIQRLKVVTANCTLLEHFTADRVDACLNDLAKRRYGDRKKSDKTKTNSASPATRNRYLAAAKSFCTWCVRSRRLPDNPLAHLSKLNEATDVRRERRTLSVHEIAHLIDTAEKSPDIEYDLDGKARAIIYRVAIGTGLRASEIGSLTTGSLSLFSNPSTIVVEAAYSKRRRRDEQPLPDWLTQHLKKWLAERESPAKLSTEPQLLWPGSWKRHAAKVLRMDLERAKIPYLDGNDRVFDFHALRHQYISNLADAGVHPRTAQELARHSSIDLTMKRYTHLSMRNVAGAVDVIPEPQSKSKAKATGTIGRTWNQGDARVTAKASHQGQNCHFDDYSAGAKTHAKNAAKALPFQELAKAEGKGFEPSTGFPAPDFESGR
jgi:integrase